MGNTKAKSKTGVQAGYMIYLPGGKIRTVGGSAVSLEVKDGSLVLLDSEKNTHALAPGERLAVKFD